MLKKDHKIEINSLNNSHFSLIFVIVLTPRTDFFKYVFWTTRENLKKFYWNVFIVSCLLNYGDHRRDLPTIWKKKLVQIHIEKFKWYLWKLRLAVLLKWNQDLMTFKVDYDLNQLKSYRNILQFQIRSTRKSR